MHPNCPLCNAHTQAFHQIKNRDYFQCTNCQAILLHPEQYMTAQDEEKHYRFHNNDVTDAGYLHFVSPITQGILHDFSPSHSGLDFGAGTGSAVSKVLNDNGYAIVSYDPFFHPYPEVLAKTYDYIACCEVIEHFHHPAKEFELLHHLLIPKGKLYCMTHLYDPSIDFNKWYYKNDTTHVFMYQKETIRWIAQSFGFSDFDIINRLIIFTK
ncbi:methyltransferase [Flavobacterium covae]|uniref:class I SAM-dependent methyltransferase n=1 Tax=Flavobacterium covae TaxID=2906076 RepID=UPI000B4D408A|nr:class I SAM-dependent methyltransferase [Flavobacterium covae]OWP87414.1 methyltransferase [Flavobacterium covae]